LSASNIVAARGFIPLRGLYHNQNFMTHYRWIGFALIGFLFLPVLADAASSEEQRDLIFETTGILRETIHANRTWGERNTAPDGAYSSVNIAWDKTHTGNWYIEQQRDAFDIIAIGLAFHDSKVVDRGIRVLEWGFRQQNPDGSFPCDDAFHSTSFFLEAAAHSLIVLRADPMGEQFAPRLNAIQKKIALAARWMTRHDVEAVGQAHNHPFTHRRFLVGAALGEAAVVLKDTQLQQKSEEYIRDGLALQWPNGVNPEKGGFDTNYQAVGLSYALRYYRLVATPELQAEMKPHLEKGIHWLSGRVAPDGTISAEGNTRSGGEEKSRNGTPKGVNYIWAVRSFADWAQINGNHHDDELALKVWQRWQMVKPA
jgi:hypothetical protein